MMKYGVNYQYLPKDSANGRPIDDGATIDMPTSDTEIMLLPSVGDYVSVDRSIVKGESFSGKVRSKLFRYIVANDGQQWCQINIVVEEDNDDWGMLIKE